MAESGYLALENVEAFYGESQALHGTSFTVNRGEVATLIGRNGAGKTTTLRAIMGLLPRRTGRIEFDGTDLLPLRSHQIARLGIAYCPEERGIFASLSVQENLTLPPVVKGGGMSIADIYALFPNLRERASSQGTKLSGGEQQMLAIARILRTGATMLLLDEPTEGLAPTLVEQIGRAIARLKAAGFTILLVEQNFRFAQSVADRHYVMESGRIVDCVPAADLDHSASRLLAYLGV